MAGIMALFLVLTGSMHVFALSSPVSPIESAQGPYESYTYWYDSKTGQKEAVYCKPMYRVDRVIDGVAIGAAPFTTISDICTDEEHDTYLLDGTDSKVLIFDEKYELKKEITAFSYRGEKLTFRGAKGIVVKDKVLYVADTENARVIISDLEGVVKEILTLPQSRLIPEGFAYKPIKVAVDSTNTIYVASDGSYYGAIVYSPEKEFMGFFGANTVPASLSSVINTVFDRLFSNDIKKGASLLSLPYQINDLVVGPDDFIYTASAGNSSTYTNGQVHVLNPGGKDTIGKDSFNFADTKITIYAQMAQYQSIRSIDVDQDGFFYILDVRYGRVFWYDKNCNLLCVFGGSVGSGTQRGTFVNSVALAVNGDDLLVADDAGNSFTVFSMTEYGAKVRNAQWKTINGYFADVESEWEQIVRQDANSQLAYCGLAKVALAKKEYKTAMEYAKLANERNIYAKAFKGARAKFAEKWFGAIVFAAVVAVAGLSFFFIVKRKKNIVLIQNEKAVVLKESVFHPFRSFGAVKEKNMGSPVLATVLLILFYAVSAISDVSFGFAYNSFNANTYNSFYMFLRTVGLVVLWVISNWLVCVLLGGIGKLKEIYTVTCYGLMPIIFSTLAGILLSHILVPDEFVFVSIFMSVCVGYSLFLIAVGTMRVHDYSFGKFLGTTVLSVISMLIILFLIFLIFLLAQQVYAWVVMVIKEINMK